MSAVPAVSIIVVVLALTAPAAAHNPIFAPGAHVHAKDSHEVSLGYHRGRASGNGGNETEQELSLEYAYGVTADWTVAVEVPFADKKLNGGGSTGLGDIQLAAKYRFLRIDSPGAQLSTALILKVKLPTGDDGRTPRLGSGSTDFVGGLLHGLESRRWYYTTAFRYRLNTEGGGDLKKGDKVFLDLVGGIRPAPTEYREADTVVFLELNWEHAARDSLAGADVTGSGGWTLFLSPGVFWTYRVYAITGGVQVPIAENLNGAQPSSDYRFKLTGKYAF